MRQSQFMAGILLFFLSLSMPVFAAHRIGVESVVTTPTSAHYSTTMNIRPGNGEVVTNNPPIFTWFYNTNYLTGGEQNPNGFYPHWQTQTNAFQFQITTAADTGFASPVVDISTPFNFYNFLAPLNTNTTRSFRWRVKYITNGVAYCTSAAYTFSIAAASSPWDRSLLADANYHTTNSVHPMFGYRAGQEAAVWTFVTTSDARQFQDLTNAAVSATNQSWFHSHHLWGTNASPFPTSATVPVTQGDTRSVALGSVLFMHRFSGDNAWTNASMTGWLFTNLYHVTHWFLNPSNNYAMQDYGDNQSIIPLRLCVATYDWLYDYLGSDTGTFNGQLRTNALQVMRLQSRFAVAMDLWFPHPFALGQFVRNVRTWGYRDYTINTIRHSIEITNLPVNGDSLIVNGVTHRWTNAPLDATWVETGASTNRAMTNLVNFFTTNYPSIQPAWVAAPWVFITSTETGDLLPTTNRIVMVGTYASTNNVETHYTNIFSVQAPSMPKQDSSHLGLDRDYWLVVALAGGYDDPEIAFYRDMILHYYIARGSGWNGWAASHIGVYGYVDGQMSLAGGRAKYSAYMNLHTAFPQAQFMRNDFGQRFAEWYTRLIPYRKRMTHGAYGDGMPLGWAGNFFGARDRGLDLARLTQSGVALQLYNLNNEFSNTVWDSSSAWDLIPARSQFAIPAVATNSTSALFVEDGFVVASQISPSLYDCYTNGVGFSIYAPPRGNLGNHQVASSLSVDMWAYGTQLTDGGGGSLDPYGYTDSGNPGMFVNGYGISEGESIRILEGTSQLVDKLASITAYTNSGTNFVYTAADGTGNFTNVNHVLSNLVTKVKRHILFPRSKYWVIYDEYAATSNSIFAFRWHVPWAFRYEFAGSEVGSEVNFRSINTNLFGSNSMTLGTNGLTYTGGNYANAAVPNPPRVPVHVMFVNATNQWGLFAATGTNTLSFSVPANGTMTNVLGTANTNSTLNPFLQNGSIRSAGAQPDRAAGLWVTNTVAATNWHFMTVIVPQQNGVAAPTFARLDDNTVVVNYDGVTETNTFGTNYVGAYTYMVELDALANSESGSSTNRRNARATRAVVGVKIH